MVKTQVQQWIDLINYDERVNDMKNEQAYRKLYTAANMLMAKVGCEGEIELNTMDELTLNIMDALYEIDGGSFDNEEYGFKDEA